MKIATTIAITISLSCSQQYQARMYAWRPNGEGGDWQGIGRLAGFVSGFDSHTKPKVRRDVYALPSLFLSISLQVKRECH